MERAGVVSTNGKLVVLKFNGDFQQGFQVTLEIGSERDRPSIELMGALPPNPELALHLFQWQQLYRSLSMSSASLNSRIQPQQIIYGGSVNRLADCYQSATELQHQMMHWLDAATFRRLDQRLRESLGLDEYIRVLIRTQDPQLRRLPWHLWDFVERYPKTEVALSAPVAERVDVEPLAASDRGVKVLAILGNSQDINVQADRQFLQALPDAIVTVLVEPSRQQINQQVWEQAWDILFFAGHSVTEGDRGIIYINPRESLSLEELKYGLRQAVSRGLQLAIFNSCDGLGLAQALEPLHLPQIIVMRAPVPDRVAQEFLKHLLAAYAGGKSLYLAVREARERLQGIEDQFPCATWLPVICQNSTKIPPTWQELVNGVVDRDAPSAPLSGENAATYSGESSASTVLPRVETSRDRNSRAANYVRFLQYWLHWLRQRGFILLVSVAVAIGVMGIRPFAWLQSWELRTYDQMMQQRPDEGSDPRLLIVEVTDADIAAQQQRGELLQRRSQSAQSLNQLVETSLSDESLDRLLGILAQHQPRVIGLDVYRDFAVGTDQTGLATRLRHPELITVCKAEDFESPDIPSVNPAPEVALDRIGFSDFREDSDGVLRRHLLGMSPLLRTQVSRCNVDRAFSVQVAAQYLSRQNVTTQFTANGDLQLGEQIFQILRSGWRGYPPSKSGGSEILLNYRSTAEVADRVTLQQLLNGQINPDYLKDKIVLVGVTASGGDDRWMTPIAKTAMPGVFIQAHMVSQLLSAALNGRPIVMVLSQWQEMGWMWTWALVGGFLAFRQWQRKNISRSLSYLAISLTVATFSLYGLCWLGLLRGRWLPFVPSMLALVLSSSIVTIYCLYRSQKRSTLSSL